MKESFCKEQSRSVPWNAPTTPRLLEIAQGEVFDPAKEVRSIGKEIPEGLPQKDRLRLKKDRLEQFEKELASQKEGLAILRERMVASIREHPDTPLAELKRQADEIAAPYRITDYPRRETYRALSAYEKKHRAVENLKARCREDAQMAYALLFRECPEGAMDIHYGPMTVFLRCKNLKDYAWIFSGLYNEAPQKTKRNLTPELIERANKSGGLTVRLRSLGDLSGCVIVEKATEGDDQEHIQKVLAHEEAHAIEFLFTMQEEEGRLTKKMLDQAQTPQEKKHLLQKFFLKVRRDHDPHVKNEIFAYFTDGRKADEIKTLLTKKEDEGGLYDYFTQARENLAPSLAREFGESYRSMIDEIVNEIFDLTQDTGAYYRYISNKISVFQKLLDHGYSVERAKGFLEYEPMWKWEKAVKRQIERKPPKEHEKRPEPEPKPAPKPTPPPKAPLLKRAWSKIKEGGKKLLGGIKNFGKKVWGKLKEIFRR